MISNRILIHDFQTVEHFPLKLFDISKYLLTPWICKISQGANSSSRAAWHRKQVFPNAPCHQVQKWIFKSTICQSYSLWIPCTKSNTIKWSSRKNSLQKISGFKVPLNLSFFRFYFKQKYSQITESSQTISRTQERRGMTTGQRWASSSESCQQSTGWGVDASSSPSMSSQKSMQETNDRTDPSAVCSVLPGSRHASLHTTSAGGGYQSPVRREAEGILFIPPPASSSPEKTQEIWWLIPVPAYTAVNSAVPQAVLGMHNCVFQSAFNIIKAAGFHVMLNIRGYSYS